MALLYFEGFDTYGVIPTSSTTTGVNAKTPLTAAGWFGEGITTPDDNKQLARPPTAYDSNSRNWISSFGTTPIAPPGSIPYMPMQKDFPTTSGNTLVVGFKFGLPTFLSGAAFNQALCRLYFGRYAFDLTISNPQSSSPDTLFIYSLDSSTTRENLAEQSTIAGGATKYTVGASTFSRTSVNTVEIQIAKTTGLATIWINNVFVTAITIAPAAASGVDLGAGILLGEWSDWPSTTGVRNPIFVTDLYALDNGGSAPTSRLGKVKVVTRVPTADVQAQFTRPSGAGTNASVAAQIPPSSSNFLSGVTAGDTDLYSSSAFGFSNETIIATSFLTSGFKTDASGNDMAAVMKIGATVYEGPVVPLAVAGVYSVKQSIFTTNPATGLKFTKAELDALAFGVRVKAPAG